MYINTEDLRKTQNTIPRRDLFKLALGVKPSGFRNDLYENLLHARVSHILFASTELLLSYLAGLALMSYLIFWIESSVGYIWLGGMLVHIALRWAAHVHLKGKWQQGQLTLSRLKLVYRLSSLLLCLLIGTIPLILLGVPTSLEQHSLLLDVAFLFWVLSVTLWLRHDLIWAYLIMALETTLFLGIHLYVLQDFNFYHPLIVGVVTVFAIIAYHSSMQHLLSETSQERLKAVASDLSIVLTDFENNSSNWLFQIDKKGVISEFPKGVLARYPHVDIRIGRTNIYQLIDPDTPGLKQTVDRFEKRKDLYESKLLIRNTKDEKIWWRARGKKLTNEQGEFTGYRIVCGDISLEMGVKELERRKLRHDAIINMSGYVAHDFNNCLSSISASLGILREDENVLKAHGGLIETAQNAVRVAARTTRDLLAFSNVDAGLTPKPAILSEIVKEVIDLLRDQYNDELKFSVHCHEKIVAVVDRDNMERAIYNVVSNAAQALKGTGIIDVFVDKERQDAENERAVISIVDNGPGIPKSTAEHIFEPFFTTKSKRGGSGLGLAMARTFARQSGGDLLLIPRESGTEFRFILPLYTGNILEELLDATPEPTEVTAILPQRVLLIEDEDGTRMALSRYLEIKGHQVMAAATLSEARQCIEKATFDVIVSDVILPDGNSLTFFDEVHGDYIGANVPIILITGYSDDAIPSHYKTLLKPFDLRDVENSINSVTAKSLELSD